METALKTLFMGAAVFVIFGSLKANSNFAKTVGFTIDQSLDDLWKAYEDLRGCVLIPKTEVPVAKSC